MDIRPLTFAALFATSRAALAQAKPPITPVKPTSSPICILTNKVKGEDTGGSRNRFEVPRELGLSMIRPLAVSIPFTDEERNKPQWEIARRHGYRTVQQFSSRGESKVTSIPPKDMEAYKRDLATAITFLKPTFVVIENEENVPKFYDGTPEQYLAQLQASVEVAHRLGYKIANGGITAIVFLPVIIEDYMKRGKTAKAESLLRRMGDDYPMARKSVAAFRAAPGYADNLARGRKLMDGYRASKMDYVNFHWYGSDPSAMAEVHAFVKSYTGKEPVTHEFGQHDESPKP